MCRSILAACAVWCAAWPIHSAAAADPPGWDTARLADCVNNFFVDQGAVGCVHVNLSRVDVPALFAEYRRISGEPAGRVTTNQQALAQAVANLKRDGAREIFQTLPAGDESYLVALADEKTADLEEPLWSLGVWNEFFRTQFSWRQSSGHLDALRINRDTTPRQDNFVVPSRRLGLVDALAIFKTMDAQVVCVPTAEQKEQWQQRLAGEFPDWAEFRADAWPTGVQWVAIGINLPPRLGIRIVCQADDEASAKLAETFFAAVLKKIAELPAVKAIAPKGADLSALLAPRQKGSRLESGFLDTNGNLARLRELLGDPIRADVERRTWKQAKARLAQVHIGVLSYDVVNHRLPAGISSKAGKPLLSWRVQVLPLMKMEGLYRQFHLDEPWDSPHNQQLIKKIPDVFCGPASKVADEGKTVYVRPHGKDTLFPPDRPTSLEDVKDDDNTILLVEVDDQHAVIWTKPDDWEFDPQQPAHGLGQFSDGFHAQFCDFSCQFVPLNAPPEDLRALFTPAAGDHSRLFPPRQRGDK